MTPFKSNPANCVVDLESRAQLDDEFDVVDLLDPTEVLSDGRTPIYAQLTHAGYIAACARLGLEPITIDDVELEHVRAARNDGAVEIPAFTGTPTAEVTLEHRRKSDEANRAARDKMGWTPGCGLLVANLGKKWVVGTKKQPGPPKGRAWLMGWHVPELGKYSPARRGPGFIQPRPAPGSQGAHNAGTGKPADSGHADDGTNSRAKVRRGVELGAGPGRKVGAGVAASIVGAVTGLFSAIGRGLGVVKPQEPAHGYRCSVAELVKDAFGLETWKDAKSGYRPRRGDLLISARNGQNPVTGGSGHVEVALEDAAEGARYVETLGGNEANSWVKAPYDLKDPALRGFIVRGVLGSEAIAVALEQKAAGVREEPGARHNAQIQLYHEGARRGGSLLAGMPGHELEGVSVLGAKAADEIPWCASSVSWCMRETLRRRAK